VRAPARALGAAFAAAAAACLGAAALVASCARAPDPGAWAEVREVTPDFLAARGALHAALAADAHGRVALTFVTRDTAGAADLWLSVSADSGVGWSEPVRVNVRPGAVSSYAESRPVPAWGEGGRLAVAWSEVRGDDPMVADLVVRASGDGGASFAPPVAVNDDAGGRAAFHGFPALAFLDDGTLFAAWMDEREVRAAAARGHAALARDAEPSSAHVFAARSPDGGLSFGANRAVTDRMCPCCRPAVVVSGARVALAYRAAGGDLRDPALAVSSDGGATFALDTLIAADGWRLPGCPAVGPALAATADGAGLYAWYTGAGEPGVWVAPWRADRGLAGPKRALRDSLADASHPRLAALGGGAALLAVEGRPAGDTTRTVLAVRALEPSGALTPWVFLGARVEAGWLAALSDRAALAAWTEREADGRRTRIARITRR